MKEQEPSLQILKDLYAAADRFKEIQCWKWMWDSDLFGVQNPVTGEIGYCCVMGMEGKHFALAAYLGTEGMKSYYRLMSGDFLYTYLDSYISQKCLSISFENKNQLDNNDREIIKKIGYKTAGRHAWPQFRSFKPGYEPWFPNTDESVFMIQIIEQAIDVALRFRENEDLLTPSHENECLVRVPITKPEKIEWHDRWLKLEIPEEVWDHDEPLDEVRLARIKKTVTRSSEVWEMDTFFAPGRIGEKGKRSYYPYAMLCMDHDSHFIFGVQFAHPDNYKTEFPRYIMEFFEKAGFLPGEILTGKEETFSIIKPIASKLNIAVTLTSNMDGMRRAIDKMFEYFDSDAGTDVFDESFEFQDDRKPVGDFEGLTPREMHGLLYNPFVSEQSPLVIEQNVEDELIRKVNFFSDIIRYIDVIRKRQPVKLTNKGNLPLGLCRELIGLLQLEQQNQWINYRPVQSEEDVEDIHTINLLTQLAGFTKKRHGKMTLTKKCENYLDKGPAAEIYRYLFEIYITKYNWAYEDGFTESWIIQGGFGFSLYLVEKYGDKKRNVRFYVDKFLNAFPAAIEDFEILGFSAPEEHFEIFYYERAIVNFMERFGLVTIERGEGYSPEGALFSKTELFDKLISWKNPSD